MAPVTIAVIGRGVTESLNIPSGNSMAGPAVIAEFAVMGFKMTLGAGKITIKERVIHLGYIRRSPSMLRMAVQAVFVCLVKTDLGLKGRYIIKVMALQAFLVCHPLPRDMASFTSADELVG
jgi:hypothetical protein